MYEYLLINSVNEFVLNIPWSFNVNKENVNVIEEQKKCFLSITSCQDRESNTG